MIRDIRALSAVVAWCSGFGFVGRARFLGPLLYRTGKPGQGTDAKDISALCVMAIPELAVCWGIFS